MTTELRITYVGHATVLIEIAGMRILTDPVVRGRVGHLVRRVPAPDRALLERIDLVLISHAHHDHLDGPSLARLGGNPRVLAPPDGRRTASLGGREHTYLEADAAERIGKVTIEATHADHDGRRYGKIGDPTSVGYIVRGDSHSVYFAGDTDLFDAMAKIAGIDVALIPVAGWGPNLGPGHIDPREAAEAVAMIEPKVAIPIHWGTISRIGMSTEGRPDRPAREFAEHVAELAPETRVHVLQPGESFSS